MPLLNVQLDLLIFRSMDGILDILSSNLEDYYRYFQVQSQN